MSHIVTIQTEIRDAAAVQAACRRLGLAEPVHETVKLFGGEASGLRQLCRWSCYWRRWLPLIETDELLAKPLLPMTDPKHTMTWWVYSLGLYQRILENVGFAIESVTPAFAYHEPERNLVERRTIVAKKITASEPTRRAARVASGS